MEKSLNFSYLWKSWIPIELWSSEPCGVHISVHLGNVSHLQEENNLLGASIKSCESKHTTKQDISNRTWALHHIVINVRWMSGQLNVRICKIKWTNGKDYSFLKSYICILKNFSLFNSPQLLFVLQDHGYFVGQAVMEQQARNYVEKGQKCICDALQ